MVQSSHGRAVIDRAVEWSPEEKLVDAAESTVRIAADEIHVKRLEIRRRIRFSRYHIVAKILDVRSKDRLDAVGVFFPHGFRPAAISRRGYLPGGVTLDEARHLRKLQPQDRRAGRTARRIE